MKERGIEEGGKWERRGDRWEGGNERERDRGGWKWERERGIEEGWK